MTRVAGTTQTLNSVATAARMLREFGKGDTQLGVSELARRMGVGKSTAHRVVWTLVSEGLLEKVDGHGAVPADLDDAQPRRQRRDGAVVCTKPPPARSTTCAP